MRKGSQYPRVRIVPEYQTTYGDDCISLLTAYGNEPFEWQQNFIKDMLAHDESGKPLCSIVGLDVPRQNGKNFILEGVELFAIAVLGWRVLHTAHEVKTARESFLRLASYFEKPDQYPELAEMVKAVRRTNGQEGIYLQKINQDTGKMEDWGSIQFSSRTKGASRGFADIQVVVFDEGQELTDEQLGAIMPTLAASSTGTRMMIYTGTPTPPTSNGNVMSRIREKVINGEEKNAMWHSFSIEDISEMTPSWEQVQELVYATNPSMSYTLNMEFARSEFISAPPLQFAQERLNWWIKTEAQTLISSDDLSKCETLNPPNAEDCITAYGIKFSPDGAEIAIGICALEEDRKPHIELINVIPNNAQSLVMIGKMLEEARANITSVIIDGNGSQPLFIELTKGNYHINKRMLAQARVKDMVSASQMLKLAIDDHDITYWADEGQNRLKFALLNSTRRQIGKDGWSFDGDDASPAEACALALLALKTTKRNPNRKLRIG